METIVDNFKKLNTPSRADLMIKLMHVNTLILMEKLGGSMNLSQPQDKIFFTQWQSYSS